MTKELEKLYNSATFESPIDGDDKPFNAVDLAACSYPYIGGCRVECIEVNGIAIAKIIDTEESKIEYRKMTEQQKEYVTNLEYDACDDAAYSRSLLIYFGVL